MAQSASALAATRRMHARYRAKNETNGIDLSGTKPCNRCGETKPRAVFVRNMQAKDGLSNHCRVCQANISAEWRRRNPDAAKRNKKKYLEKKRLANVVVKFDGEKKCSKCSTIKPKASFSRCRTESDGLHRHCKACMHEYWVERHRHTRRKHHLRVTFGITPEDYDHMVANQGGVCAICNRPDWSSRQKRLSIDHDHATGAVRALPCSRCNTILGLANDDEAVLSAAIAYLRKHAGV